MTDDLAIAIDASPRARTWFGPLALSVATGAALVSLICTALINNMRFHDGCYHANERRIAKLVVTQYANNAYPAWAVDHPGQACPSSVSELDPYMDRTAHRDPWGRNYVFTCGGGKLYVVSLGMDGRSNTADDIWSHQ
jgi:hypothetical protein